jgi:hypothetical protein
MNRIFALLAGMLLLLCSGCATVPYHFGKEIEYVQGPPLAPNEPQFTYGRPNKFLDASDWFWPGSLLGKLVLWNLKVDSHQFSTQTVFAVQQFMTDNEIKNVKVRINEYDVVGEWRRTIHNTSIGFGWRYTMGVLGWLGYTIMPGRFFGGDNYNPYSNTINLYSDLPSVGLHEAGHSKDFAGRTYKGTYGVIYSFIPLFNLYPEALASTEALSYLYAKGDTDTLKSGYKLLYPAYGTYLGSGIGQFIAGPAVLAVELGVIIPGHIIGRVKAHKVPDNLTPQADAPKTPAPLATP